MRLKHFSLKLGKQANCLKLLGFYFILAISTSLFSAPAEAAFRLKQFCHSLVRPPETVPLFEARPQVVVHSSSRPPAVLKPVSEQARPDFTAQLDKVFTEVFDEMYSVEMENKCTANVITLFNEFQRQIPQLRFEDFKVMIITPPEFGTYTQNERNIQAKNSRRLSEISGPWNPDVIERWSFHAVLIYKDRVYDLDYRNSPQLVSIREFLSDDNYILPISKLVSDEGSYFHQNKSSLDLFIIDGEQYLWLTPAQVLTTQFTKALVEKVKPVALQQYLNSLPR